MSDVARRWRTLADGFSARVDGVDPGGWEQPAPCEGWVARDVVRHLVAWVPDVLGLTLDPYDVEQDPAGAWRALDRAVRQVLADPVRAAAELDLPPGRMPLERAVAVLVLPDVLVHTWDLARATGQDEVLDAGEVTGAVAGLSQVDEQLLVSSGHYGPRVQVPADADEQTRLIALTGRDPQSPRVSRSASSAE